MTLKRKIETGSKNSGNGQKASKVQLVEARMKPEAKKKPLTKSEIIINYKALEENYENIVKENERNLLKIAMLEQQKITKLSREQESQTKAEGKYVEISCIECIFLASYTFSVRVELFSLGCNFCDEDFRNKDELMKTKSSKQTQTETDLVSKCEECNFEGSIERN